MNLFDYPDLDVRPRQTGERLVEDLEESRKLLNGAAGKQGYPASASVPRFEGRIVSHADTYGSGTGTASELSADGSMTSGRNYGDPARPDWSSDIQWSFLRLEGAKDVYRVEWIFRPKNGTSRTQTVITTKRAG